MWYMWLMLVTAGLANAYASYLTRNIPSDMRTGLNVGFMAMVEGLGCIIGSLTSAIATDKFNVMDVGRAGMGWES